MNWITLPQNDVVAGQSGHLSDHDDIYSGLLTLWTAASQGSINVCSPTYGADPTGVADSTAAINAALATAGANGGGDVFLPQGQYLVSAPLTIPPFVHLVGPTAVSLNLNTPPSTLARIVASAAWAPGSTAGVVEFLSKTPGGWSTNMASAGLRGVFIDCSLNSSANLNGIFLNGPCYDPHVQDVLVYEAPHNGITASGVTESGITPTFPFHVRFDRVSVVAPGNYGFSVPNFTDSEFVNCLAFGTTSSSAAGWNIQNCSNSKWTTCRGEWMEYGFSITGSSGTLTFTGCSTDQNSREGLLITSATGQATQGGGITWTGGKMHADGWAAASGHTYGIQITGSTVPVALNGVVVESGQNPNNSGYFPATALDINTSSNVTVNGCDLQGISSAWTWDGAGAGTVKRHGCLGMTGDPNSQVAVSLPNLPYAWGPVPQDQGLLAWNYDPLTAGSGTATISETLYLLAIQVREPLSVTNIVLNLTTVGGTLTSSESLVALFNSSGTQIGVSADQSTAWGSGGSTGAKTIPLASGPFAIPAGLYYVAILSVGSGTMPSFLRAGLTGTASAADGGNATAATFRFAVNGTSATSMPSSLTLSSNAHSGAEQYWVGLS